MSLDLAATIHMMRERDSGCERHEKEINLMLEVSNEFEAGNNMIEYRDR